MDNIETGVDDWRICDVENVKYRVSKWSWHEEVKKVYKIKVSSQDKVKL